MPRRFLSGLRSRLLFLISLAVLPAFALMLYAVWADRVEQRQAVADRTVELARIVANDQERAVDLTRRVLADLASVPDIRAGHAEGSRAYLNLLRKQFPGYASFNLVDTSGNVVFSAPSVDRPINVSDRQWFQRALQTKEFTIGDYQVGQVTGKQIVVAALPVLDESGRVSLFVTSGLDLAWLNQVVATAQLPAGSVLIVIDRSGAVVARYPATVGPLGQGLADAELAARLRESTEGVFDEPGDAEDGDGGRLYAYTSIRGRVDTGWRLVIGVPRTAAFSAALARERRQFGTLVLALFVTLVAAWAGAERLVLRRVGSLLDAIRKFAAGDQGARTQLPYGHSELSDLARAFDDMAAAVQARQAERDTAERALRDSEARFRAFMDNSPVLAFMRDADGRYIYGNAAFERYFALEPGAWSDTADARFWAPETADQCRRDADLVLASRQPKQDVAPVRLADGRERVHFTITFPVGERSVGTLTLDLTEWRQVQDDLARAEQRFTDLFEQTIDGIVVTDANLRIVAVNDATCRLGGFTRAELLQLRLDNLVRPEDLAEQPLQHSELRSRRNLVTVRQVRRKDGSQFWAELTSQALGNGGVQAFVRDVSERYAAERSLKESEERFRLLYQNLPLAHHALAEDGTIVLVNDAWLALTAFTRERVMGQRFESFLSADSVAAFRRALRTAIETGESHGSEVTIEGERTARVTVALDARCGRDEHGGTRVHFALHDVTAAHAAQMRIRESEERYRTLFDESPVSLWEEDFSGIKRHIDRLRSLGVTDLDEHFRANPDELADCIEAVRVVDVNRATLALYGAENRSQLLAGLDRIIGQDGHEVFRQSIISLARGERTWRSEGINYKLDGEPIRLALQWAAPPSETEWSRVIVSAVDVTDRVRVEGALRESEARFERIFRLAPEVMGISRLSDGEYLDVNDAFVRIIGYRRDEALGRTSESLGLWADAGERARVVGLLQERPFIQGLNLRVRTKSGRVINGLASIVPLRMWGEECLLVQVVDTTPLRLAEEAREESQRMLTNLMANLPGMVYQCCLDPEWTMLVVSEGTRELTGYAPADLVGNRVVSYGSLIVDEDRDAVAAGVREAIEEKRPYRLTYRIRRADGDVRWVWEQGSVGIGKGDGVPTLEGFIADITDRRRAELEIERINEQLRQAQKMEAVGRLAGGIAHDFNNVLTAILGYSDIVLSRLAANDPLRDRVSEIRRAGERAAGLTRQLLTFSRKQVLSPEVLNVDDLIGGLAPMLARLIGANIEFRFEGGCSARVKADPTQIEQVFMNLVVNARDAMPRGGVLRIETGETEFTDAEARFWPHIRPGRFVTVSVSDTGIGMDEATRARLFEPFFTTKAVGLGTGLGLSTVYGIVQQSGGFVSVESKPGAGSTFCVWLPAVDEEPSAQPPLQPSPESYDGSETVLVAEDEPSVRGLVRASLERLGYRILEANDGREAFDICMRDGANVDLLLTDIVMPNIDGPGLVERLAGARISLPVIYMSGYADESVLHRDDLQPAIPFLQKPFTSTSLARLVRTVLDRWQAGADRA
jgi:two-component system, cell cycle sensor histidine kinase and response regulator CckA